MFLLLDSPPSKLDRIKGWPSASRAKMCSFYSNSACQRAQTNSEQVTSSLILLAHLGRISVSHSGFPLPYFCRTGLLLDMVSLLLQYTKCCCYSAEAE